MFMYLGSNSQLAKDTAFPKLPHQPRLLTALGAFGLSIKVSAMMTSMITGQVATVLSTSSCLSGNTDLAADSCQILSRPTGLAILFKVLFLNHWHEIELHNDSRENIYLVVEHIIPKSRIASLRSSLGCRCSRVPLALFKHTLCAHMLILTHGLPSIHPMRILTHGLPSIHPSFSISLYHLCLFLCLCLCLSLSCAHSLTLYSYLTRTLSVPV